MHRLFENALVLDFRVVQLRSIQEVVFAVIDWVTNDVQVVFQGRNQGIEFMIQGLV